ncbi:MAG: asparagine synthase (glutamine-hydrolyzing) [Candidatus Omnitrophica bacterium]|nr:asparagine synthase (glutamine-hydrolyzing) [Candidatus Omnitrophota bacterium]
MCGICGFYSKKSEDLREGLKGMQSLLTHRGPDSKGIYEKDNVGLAISRLSVVDVEGSDQPLYNEDKSIVVVYNGMIYNYKKLRKDLRNKGHCFRTKGDGEVILHLYEEKGVECFKFLHGMFAVALYDIKKNKIVLARDHIGIKPLYYYFDNNKILFSSEIKGFINTGLIEDTLDPESLSLYFSYNYIPGEKTIYKDLYELLPGHFLKIDNNFKPVLKRYWGFNSQKYNRLSLSLGEINKDLENIVNNSIEKHMQSDVEIGCFLSGGLDSSSLVHFLSQKTNNRVKTFSVGYANKYYDELKYARIISEQFNTEHREITCTKDDVIDFLDNLSEIGDSPVADQSSLSTFLVSKLASNYVKVCFSGEGADELFLGYPTYFADFLYPWFSWLPGNCFSFAEKFLSGFPSSDKKLSFDYKFIRFIQGLKFKNLKHAHSFWRIIFQESDKNKLFKLDFWDKVVNLDIIDSYFERLEFNHNVAEACVNADLNTWLPFNNLLRTDIYSMRNSLEVRVPFLYQPLIEYLTQLPFNVRFNILTRKHLLKRVMKGKIDPKIINRKKQGWHMPLASWLKSSLFSYSYDIFNSRHRLFDNFINRKECLDLLIKHKRKKENNSFKIWSLLVLLKQIKP